MSYPPNSDFTSASRTETKTGMESSTSTETRTSMASSTNMESGTSTEIRTSFSFSPRGRGKIRIGWVRHIDCSSRVS
jgi:hypothetical protein